MADSKLTLPGDFDETTAYMLQGKTLNAWRKALLADRVVPGYGLKEFQTAEGRVFQVDGEFGTAASCPLGAFTSDSDNPGALQIQPSYISGGGNTIQIQKNNIVPVAGQHLYVKVSWTGDVEDGILLESGTMTAATVEQGSSIPADSTLSVGSPSGFAYVPLGNWDSNEDWQNASCGGITIRFKCGNFEFVRS